MGLFSRKSETKVAPPSPGQIALAKAVRAFDSISARAALDRGADPNGGEDVAISPLVSAFVSVQAWLDNSLKRQQDIIMLLLEAGARPEWGGRDGQNPYELALRQGRTAVVATMLSKGASIDRVGLTGPTPLQVVMTPNEYGQWPLAPLVQALLDAGADPSKGSRQQGPPILVGLRNATLAGAPDLEEALLLLAKHGGVSSEQAQEWVALADSRGLPRLSALLQDVASTSGAHDQD